MNADMYFKKLALQTESVDLFSDLSESDKTENRLVVAIATAILRNRKTLGLSQTDLANIIGVTQPMISQWESGDCNFSVETIAKIAEALNLKVDISFLCERAANPTFTNASRCSILNFEGAA